MSRIEDRLKELEKRVHRTEEAAFLQPWVARGTLAGAEDPQAMSFMFRKLMKKLGLCIDDLGNIEEI